MECILELALEGSVYASTNKKVPKVIRYPLIALIVLFFLAVILLIFFVGILLIKQNIWAGICMVAIGIAMLISSVLKFREIYLRKEKKQE